MMASEIPLIDRIDCIRLAVSDLDAGLRFYRDRLGHTLVWRTDSAAGLRLPGTDAEIVIHTESIPPEIDFRVDSADAAARRFEAAGGQIVVPPFDIQIGRCVVVQDPWGNRFVLLDLSKGLLNTDEDGNVVGNQPPHS
jgi:lactoylglutathione lyase